MSMDELAAQYSAAMSGRGADMVFKMAYKYAREWQDAEKRKDTRKLAQLDFGVGPMCIRCSKPCLDPVTKQWKPMRCSRCQAVLYCSRPCQVADWKQALTPNTPSHKDYCPRNQEHMKRLPYFQSEFKQFPWARIETDGTCSHDVLKARFGVLGSGAAAFGYWSVPGGNQPHDSGGLRFDPVIDKRGPTPVARTKGYVHGEVLLSKEWPTDVEAWKLKDEKLVPRLFFDDDYPPPKAVARGEIKDWKTWYAWRGLGLESPAAQLVDTPLSVYHLLTDILNVADASASAQNRQSLEVHYIGAEIELNFLPLFSELALLLPHTDITLVLFGRAVCDLVRAARAKYPGALATEDVVWSYTAPKKTGGGSIAIKLHADNDTWTRQAARQAAPDALIGINAGLLSYSAWGEPILFSAILDIPFGVTEYAEQSMETCAGQLPRMCSSGVAQMQLSAQFAAPLLKERPHPITVNPFHRPGQRPLPVVRLPNCYSGFAMPVVLKEV